MKRIAVLSLTMITLTGCGNFMWVRPGGSQVDANKDQHSCTIEAAQALPVQIVQKPDNIFFPNGRNIPVETTCHRFGNQLSCTSTGGYQPPTYSTVDVNKRDREDAVRYCMKSKGWTYEFISKQDQSTIPR